MNIGNGFFSDTVQDALREMTERSGCKVMLCPYPTHGKLAYYISEKGDLYGMQNVMGKYITRTKKNPIEGHSKRKCGGLTARLCTGNGHKKGKPAEVRYPLEWLTFCTFVLKRWEPVPQPLQFIDGNAKNVRPENLLMADKVLPEEWSERMNDYGEIYKREFNRVAEIIKWRSGISKEDARDVAQSTFIWLLTEGYKGTFSTALWAYYGKKRGYDFKYRNKFFESDEFDETFQGFTYDKPVEIDLYHLQKGEKRARYLQLWAHGHTPTEVAEICGTTLASTGSMISRSVQFLEKYLRNEKKYLRP